MRVLLSCYYYFLNPYLFSCMSGLIIAFLMELYFLSCSGHIRKEVDRLLYPLADVRGITVIYLLASLTASAARIIALPWPFLKSI